MRCPRVMAQLFQITWRQSFASQSCNPQVPEIPLMTETYLWDVRSCFCPCGLCPHGLSGVCSSFHRNGASSSWPGLIAVRSWPLPRTLQLLHSEEPNGFSLPSCGFNLSLSSLFSHITTPKTYIHPFLLQTCISQVLSHQNANISENWNLDSYQRQCLCFPPVFPVFSQDGKHVSEACPGWGYQDPVWLEVGS